MDKIIVHSTANTKTKRMAYKGFNESTNKWIFKVKYKGYCTQNVADFMAIVHALHYCKINNIDLPIYNDNLVAIKWVKDKKVNSLLIKTKENHELFQSFENALVILKQNDFLNPILFWKKKELGNIKNPFYSRNST